MRRTLILSSLLVACGVETTGPTSESPFTAALDFTAGDVGFCVDPPEVAVDVAADSFTLPPNPVSLDGAIADDGLRLSFFPSVRRPDRVQVLLQPEIDATLDRTFANVAVRVQKESGSRLSTDGRITLSSGGRSLAGVDLLVTYGFASTRLGRSIGIASLALADRASGAIYDQYDPGLGFVDVPGSCEEQAMVRFGPFPYGMPAVKFPEIVDCSASKCADVAEAWLHLHHNVWRANQMFALLDPMHVEQKKYFWEQPGTDANGDPVTVKTSPAYWYGEWDGDRYDAIREVMHKYFDIVKSAKTDIISIKLQCPDYSENPGNVCFSSDVLGHHWVKGWINFCGEAWSSNGCVYDTVEDTIDEVMHHEPLHHVFTHMNGIKALRDTISHFHGGACLSDATTKPVYCEEDSGDYVGIRHFVEYGNQCWHLDKVVQSVDAHAQFIRLIGDMVDTGKMTHWPKLGDPTPQPPECTGEIGCLCEQTDWHEPDGDYAIDTYCPDNDGLAVCMTTTFNASSEVGICTLCDEWRGPGCPCNDVYEPCDQGSCWGDDTNGPSNATGTCYLDDNVPIFGCLADCEALLGNGAFCMHDHPDHARCVPVGTTLPEASNCWWSVGHMDPQTLSCTSEEECIDDSDCHDLGYPIYFECDASLRCVPNP